MSKSVIQVGFNTVREIFEEHAIGEDFMIFDNLMEKINPEGKAESVEYNFPIKLNITILALCTEGLSRIKIGLKEILLKKNRLAVIMPGQIFQIAEITSDFKGMFIALKNNFFNIQNYFMEVMALQKTFIQQHYLEFPNHLIPEFISICNLIKEKIHEENNYYRIQIIQNYCSILLYNVCNIYIQQDKKENNKEKTHKEKIFETFIKEAEKHYREEHTILYYADKLCLTPKYLSAIVFEISGKTAADWLKEYLILEAQALLSSGKMTVQQVSNELNFANQSHFGRFFKHYTGVSPKKYRK